MGAPAAALANLALVEGSDATGASAQAMQSAQAATAATPAPAVMSLPATTQGFSSQSVPGVSASGSAGSLSTTTLHAGGDARSRDGSGAGNDPGTGSDPGAGGGAMGGDAAAALQQLGTTQASTTTDSTPAPAMAVHANVDSSEFPQAVADRVSFAVDNGWSSAKLSVNPPQLGPIELQIAIQGQHAQVAMSTHSAVTREALESSTPKLKEMLNSQGFTQVSVDISQRSFQERSSTPQQYASWPSNSSTSTAAVVATPAAAAARTAQGMLDAYA